MRLSAVLLVPFAVLVFAAAVSPLVGQEPRLPTGVPVALADRVREEVALRWAVPTETVVLEVGSPRGERALNASGDFVLIGSGAGGYWVLRATATDGGDGESVRVRAGVWEIAQMAARRIGRGEVLMVSDLLETLSISWGEPRAEPPGAVEGWVAQRLIREGEALKEPAVKPPLAVRSGETVELVWARGGVGIRAAGRAAGSAPVGHRVYVRTMSGKRILGVVVAPGLVNVTLGGTER